MAQQLCEGSSGRKSILPWKCSVADIKSLLVSSTSPSVRSGNILPLLAYLEPSSVYSASTFSLIYFFASSVDTASILFSLFDLSESYSKGSSSISISLLSFLVPSSYSQSNASTSASTVFYLLTFLSPYSKGSASSSISLITFLAISSSSHGTDPKISSYSQGTPSTILVFPSFTLYFVR